MQSNSKLQAINWNNVPSLHKDVWNKLTEQFWLDSRIPFSRDLKTWQSLGTKEKQVVKDVFGKLTLLDTIQSEIGVSSLTKFAEGFPQEQQFIKAIFNNIAFMESVHAKTYSSIFTTLCDTVEIDEIFEKTEKDLKPYLDFFSRGYHHESPASFKVITSVLLESFVFYSGFFYPLYLGAQGILKQTSEAIKLIIRDESVHGTYIGFLGYKQESIARQAFFDESLEKLMEFEKQFIEDTYPKKLQEDVLTFCKYNANKAADNLYLSLPYPDVSLEDIHPLVRENLATTTVIHDFFSDVGNGYMLKGVDQKDKGYEDL